MARGRARPRTAGVVASASSSPRRSTRRGNSIRKRETTPDVYQELLQESISPNRAAPDEENRPLKRRKVGGGQGKEPERPEAESSRSTLPVKELKPLPQNRHQVSPQTVPAAVSDAEDGTRQTIELTEESDDSDLEWEDALGDSHGDDDGDNEDGQDAEKDATDEAAGVSITIGGEEMKEQEGRTKAKRQGMTSAERQRRLDIHKLHILCLLYHVHLRNAWCNDEKVQAILRKLPPARPLSNLVPNPDHSQPQAAKIFTVAMQELCTFWAKRWSLTAIGMTKVGWSEDSQARNIRNFEHLDFIMDKDDFRKAAATLSGSSDVGAQLFCALLRGIGIDARLVCSLQCLPFGADGPYTLAKQYPGMKTLHLDPFNRTVLLPTAAGPARSSSELETNASPTKPTPSSSRHKPLTRLERIMGERHPSKLSGGIAPKKQPSWYKSSYPVYWVEAFNQATQKWIPVDPLSTGTVDRPEKLEPPQDWIREVLSYAMAFEEDHTARDVTRRYAKAFNAKTRKLRVEFTEGGANWLKGALKPFKRVVPLDRDQIEDAQLARREAAEGIPKGVQDFKDHPIYVLERHLRHNEVIHPKHQVGKINICTSKNIKIETIYRRKDVHIVRSADKWYRLGRDVKPGEQPLKHAKPKNGARARTQDPEDMDVDGRMEQTGTALYALFQTEQYVAPPVMNGRVPRNTFGNLDLYVPSMVPPGGVHIRHKLAAKAARIVGVDSADAVTGFSFKGRHGTAVVEGAVVAEEYRAAVEAVIEAMDYEQEEAANAQRSREALRMWRRFYLGLKIAQRINAIEIDGETGPAIDLDEEIDREDRRMAEEQLAGGFFMGDEATAEPPSRSIRASAHAVAAEDYAGGFIPDDSDNARGFLPEGSEEGGFVPEETAGGFIPEEPQNSGGGFIAEHETAVSGVTRDSNEGGGFIPEEPSAGGGFITETPGPDNGPKKDNQQGSPAATEASEVAKHNEQVDLPEKGLHRNLSPEVDLMPEGSSNEKEKVQTSQEVDTTLKQDLAAVAMESHARERPSIESTDTVVLREPLREMKKTVPIIESSSAPPSSSPSDAGSLPLEDPEDEDADPDWLVDVT